MNRWWVSLIVAFIAGIIVTTVEHYIIAPQLKEIGEASRTATVPSGDQIGAIITSQNAQTNRDRKLRGDGLRKVANAFYIKKEYEEAKYYYKRALEENSHDLESHYWLGRTYYKQEDYQKSIEEYGLALEIKQDDSRLFEALGRSYRAFQKYEEAIYNYRKSIEMEPSAYRYYSLGIAYWRREQWSEVIKCFEKALELDPEHADAKKFLAIAKKKDLGS